MPKGSNAIFSTFPKTPDDLSVYLLNPHGPLEELDKKKGRAGPQSQHHAMPKPSHFPLRHLLQWPISILKLKFVELFIFTTFGHELSMNSFLNNLPIGKDENSVDIPHR